ncbi:HAD family hydrolase [Phytomonospora endophytica]|uniref:HAD superfamily hydrolase (TIGR01509 family) n=1 Tax=Phytomonospora endophytica TaxID=714109 RepID=A0A841FN64_9ACTN|nr:HAD-IA family hydrolase [Phytomonospora endophytica]MBB6035238.1 HAD superfamily hydrolase (TIGR01509 family) [Phytomonospora endophytica]GIG64013.1 hydrolase [Phytomonospora endophytica]
MDTGALTSLFAGSGPILLDFDGPVCAVFARRPAPGVAARLVAGLAAAGKTVPAPVVSTGDPLAVLRWAGTLGEPRVTETVDDALTAEERAAVAVAEPTPGAAGFIAAAWEAGRRVAVVSNNGRPAIDEYLDAHGLAGAIAVVVGRARGLPGEMKPDPRPLRRALAALDAEPERAFMIGDSVADVAAARAAGVPVVGYARRPEKARRLSGAGADAVVADLAVLTGLLRPRRPRAPTRNRASRR